MQATKESIAESINILNMPTTQNLLNVDANDTASICAKDAPHQKERYTTESATSITNTQTKL